jgi:hypothetical protein
MLVGPGDARLQLIGPRADSAAGRDGCPGDGVT